MADKLAYTKFSGVMRNPYLISGILHLILLAVFTLITLKPGEAIKWHSFEWEQTYTITPPQTRGDSRKDDKQSQAGVLPIPVDETQMNEDSAPLQIPEPMEANSDLIEMPQHSREKSNSATVKQPVNTKGLSYMKNLPQGGRQGEGNSSHGFGSDFEGEGVNILQRFSPAVEVKSYGTVTMQFRLNSSGRVVSESVSIQAYTASEYINASVKALEKWRFSFTGRYDQHKVYKITFVFNPS